ncbi:hypothetical protein IEE83_30840 [Dyadobacter sp. UP-52]|uniref:Uncharacterized protein n=1 Tax=Dyadobacter subterraneus TaxID=2773304 RepID=A0ABR9WL91_9BACT|nr:hypothetical protein [Dyadobacter subterraneus]
MDWNLNALEGFNKINFTSDEIPPLTSTGQVNLHNSAYVIHAGIYVILQREFF